MDNEIEKKVRETIERLRKYSSEMIDYEQMDPVAKMMLVALQLEEQKIYDYINSIPERVKERYYADFIPYEKVGAMPAIALLAPSVKSRKDTETFTLPRLASFSFKVKDQKQQLNYLPIFETTLIPQDPVTDIILLTHDKLSLGQQKICINGEKPNRVWLGIQTKAEIESLLGVSMLITGTNGIVPERLYVGIENTELDFATMREIENIKIREPFDAQQAVETQQAIDALQASGQFFSIINKWKEYLLNMPDAALLYIIDERQNRDLFKPRAYPKSFQQWLENETLDLFGANTLWLRLDFPQDYCVPDKIEISINVLPVTNVDINNLTLTPYSPIAKLQKQEGSFFLRVLETSSSSLKQGFSMKNDEIIVRDFDAHCYNDGDLYRDVRTLYNRFIDDYHAFIEYNGIKDGEILKRLRETINQFGKSVGETNDTFMYGSGTYVMKNISQENTSSSTKVKYITTMGEKGNLPKAGEVMETRIPFIEKDVPIIVSAMGGADKATVDDRYEMLRYYALTNDRLYTKMDVDAFLRKEIMHTFGSEEFRRIFILIKIEGAGGDRSLCRGLYIDIEFKDRKNYEKAQHLNFDTLMQQRITNLSCISMPIIVTLKNLEE